MRIALDLFCLLADGDAAPAGDGGGGPPGGFFFWVIMPVMVLFWLLLLRPENKRQSEQKSMLDNLKQNDRVLTSGGIYGIVTNVQRDQDRVTIKVDEATNTKISVTLASIQRVLVDTPETDKK